MLSRLVIAVLSACCASAALADQYAYVTVQQAAAAMAAIGEGHVVQSFCAPCGDAHARAITARSLAIGRIWKEATATPYADAGTGETFWELLVNDASVDLAYLYVRRGDRWENLAMVLKLPVADVPRYLDAANVGAPKR